MSALIIGLGLTGAFTGAAASTALKIANEAGGIFLGIAGALAGDRQNNQNSPASLKAYLLAGTLGGAMIGTGAGYAIEEYVANTPEVQEISITAKSQEDIVRACLESAAEGNNVTLQNDENGQVQCVIKTPEP